MTDDPNSKASAPATAAHETAISTVVPAPTKTPLYQAVNAVRYQRQAIIKKIRDRTGHPVICYVCGDGTIVDRDDTLGFADLLHNVRRGSDLDLMIHSGGGDIDAAEKLIELVRRRVGTGHLRVIVPDYAKSAATLMVLGADSILMSDTSELGPIDPQVVLADGNGTHIRHSIQNYLDAFDAHSAALKKNPNDVVAQIMLGKLDPATEKMFRATLSRARTLAESLLKKGMLKGKNWTQAAAALIDTKRWQSHGQMISAEDARDPAIGLNVDYLEPEDERWQEYWQLYCLQRLAIMDKQKLYESDYVSLAVDAPAK